MSEHFRNEWIPAGLTLIAGVVTLVVCLVFTRQLPIPTGVSKPLGLSVIYLGIGLVLWSGMHIGSAIGGMVSTPLDDLVTSGPYRWVRHPVYLGTSVAMLGLVVVTRSVYGLLLVLLVFFPVEWHRARLEEKALENKFGESYREYARRVGAFLPGIGKHH